MYETSVISRYATKRNIMIVFGIFILTVIILYLATHGFLRITHFKNSSQFTYNTFNDDLTFSSSKGKGTFSLLPSGNHSVQTPMLNGGIDTSFVSVPRFLQSTTIKHSDAEPSINVLARGTPVRIAQTPTGLVGWDESGVITPINQTSVSNSNNQTTNSVFFPDFNQVFQINSRYIGGVTKTDNFYLPTYYDFETSDSQAFKPISSDDGLFIKHEAKGFSLYDTSAKTFNLYQPANTSVVTVKEPSDSVARFNTQPLYSIGTKRSAIVTGGDIFYDNEDPESKTKKVKLTLQIVNTSDSQIINKIPLGTALIQEVTVSPNGSYVYVRTNQSFTIYDTSSLKMVYAAPYSVNEFLWLNDDTYVFNAGDKGMSIGSVKTKKATTIAPYSLLQPTEISFTSNNQIFFTAYSKSNDNSQKPDAYSVSLDAKMDDNNKRALKELPHQANEYYVDFINGKIVVQLTRYIYSTGSFENQNAKAEAEEYIRSIFDGTLPEVEYIYVDNDLRKQSDTQDE